MDKDEGFIPLGDGDVIHPDTLRDALAKFGEAGYIGRKVYMGENWSGVIMNHDVETQTFHIMKGGSIVRFGVSELMKLGATLDKPKPKVHVDPVLTDISLGFIGASRACGYEFEDRECGYDNRDNWDLAELVEELAEEHDGSDEEFMRDMLALVVKRVARNVIRTALEKAISALPAADGCDKVEKFHDRVTESRTQITATRREADLTAKLGTFFIGQRVDIDGHRMVVTAVRTEVGELGMEHVHLSEDTHYGKTVADCASKFDNLGPQFDGGGNGFVGIAKADAAPGETVPVVFPTTQAMRDLAEKQLEEIKNRRPITAAKMPNVKINVNVAGLDDLKKASQDVDRAIIDTLQRNKDAARRALVGEKDPTRFRLDEISMVPEDQLVDKNCRVQVCDECGGTGEYVGLNKREPCSRGCPRK